MSASFSPIQQLPALTSLRFFAAMSVVLFHIPYTLPSVSKEQWFASGGALGVCFFFVLSGFILAHTNIRTDDGQVFDVRRFYAKRFARIYPLHVMLFVVWSLLFFRQWGNPLVEKINSGIANVVLLQAFFVGNSYNLGYNAVSWSVSVEALFYLLFPFIRTQRRAAYVIASHLGVVGLLAVYGSDITQAVPNFFYFNPLARLAEFASGILVYSLSRNYIKRADYRIATILQFAMVVLVVFVVLNYQLVPIPLQYPALGLFFALFIVTFALNSGWLTKILAGSFFVLLGEASFSLYMTHHMLFVLLQQWLGAHMSGLPLLAVALLCSIGLSIAVYWFFERPARSFVTNWLNRPGFAGGSNS